MNESDSTRHRVTKTMAVLAVSSVVLLSCAGNDTSAESPPVSSRSSLISLTPPSSSIPATTAPSATTKVTTEPTGLMVMISDRFAVEIGFINPETGNYLRYKTFDKSMLNGAGAVTENELAFSPDFSKYAIDVEIDGMAHTGWIDEAGNFTDVTSGESFDSFAGNTRNQAVGFDGHGNFYYTKNSDSESSGLYKVSAGETNSGSLVGPAPFGRSHLLSNGEIDINDDIPCLSVMPHTWIDSDTFVYSDDGQIFVRTISESEPPDGIASCGSATARTLLPDSTLGIVGIPMISPGGEEVAFPYRYQMEDNLYVVDINGQSPPRKLPPVKGLEIPWQQIEFMGWR